MRRANCLNADAWYGSAFVSDELRGPHQRNQPAASTPRCEERQITMRDKKRKTPLIGRSDEDETDTEESTEETLYVRRKTKKQKHHRTHTKNTTSKTQKKTIRCSLV